MTTPYVSSQHEVLLGGMRFKTLGPIRVTQASQWAPKITQGDTGRDSDPHRSTLGMSDFTGGLGLELIEGAADVTKVRFSSHDTRRRGHLRHLPRAYGPRYGRDGRDRLKGDTSAANYRAKRVVRNPPVSSQAKLFIDYPNLYCIFGRELREWLPGSYEWSGVLHTFPAIPTDVLVTSLPDSAAASFETEGIDDSLAAYGMVFSDGFIYLGFDRNEDNSYLVQEYSVAGLRSFSGDFSLPETTDNEPQGMALLTGDPVNVALQTAAWEEEKDYTMIDTRISRDPSNGTLFAVTAPSPTRSGPSGSIRGDWSFSWRVELWRDNGMTTERLYAYTADSVGNVENRSTNLRARNIRGIAWHEANKVYVLYDGTGISTAGLNRQDGRVISTSFQNRFVGIELLDGDANSRTTIKTLYSGRSSFTASRYGAARAFTMRGTDLNNAYFVLSNNHLAQYAEDPDGRVENPVDLGVCPVTVQQGGLCYNHDGTTLIVSSSAEVWEYTINSAQWRKLADTPPDSSTAFVPLNHLDNGVIVGADRSANKVWSRNLADVADQRTLVLWKNTALGNHVVRSYKSDGEEVAQERITISRTDVPGPESIAVHTENERLYVAGSDGKLEQYSLASGTYGNRIGERSVAGSPHLRGMTILGDHAYGAQVANGNTTIYKVLLAGGTIADQRTFSGKTIHALANDGNRIYALDTTASEVIVMNTDLQQQAPENTLVIVAHPEGISWSESDRRRWTEVDTPAVYMAAWDNRAWSIDRDGQMRWTYNLADWTNDAALPLPRDYANGLITAQNPTAPGEVLYVPTRLGLYIHIPIDSALRQTRLRVASDPRNGVGTVEHDGGVYFPAIEQAIYHLDTGQFQSLEEIGPRQDAGLPIDFEDCQVDQMLSWSHGLLAVLNPPRGNPTAPHNDFDYIEGGTLVQGTDRYLSIILSYRNQNWHTVWTEPALPGQTHPHVLDAIVHEAQLFIVQDTDFIIIDLERNPLELQSWNRIQYEETAETVTPWYNAGIVDVQKVALTMLGEIEWLNLGGIVVTQENQEQIGTMEVFYGVDYQDGWERLTPEGGWHPQPTRFNALGNRLPSSVLYDPLPFIDNEGLAFDAIRFRVLTAQGTINDSEWITPDIRGLTMEYYKRLGLSQRYEYTVTLDISQFYGDRSPEKQRQELQKLIETPLLTEFTYRGRGGWRTGWVKVLGSTRAEWSGSYYEDSQVTLVLTEL